MTSRNVKSELTAEVGGTMSWLRSRCCIEAGLEVSDIRPSTAAAGATDTGWAGSAEGRLSDSIGLKLKRIHVDQLYKVVQGER